MARFSYLARSIARLFSAERLKCPNCGFSSSLIVDRKYAVTKLCRCRDCSLLFRTPTDDATDNPRYYELSYSQGFTTELPNRKDLQKLKDVNFAGSEKDYSYYIDTLRSLGVTPGARIFDFGCSWGYGPFQFGQAGYDATAFEVALTRRKYAEQELAVHVVTDMQQVAADAAHREHYDCFFSSHVLEHVPTPRLAFGYAMKLLKPGGIFVSFTPNGSEACRNALETWSSLWGEVHPNFIDDIFLDRSFLNSPRAFGSSPVDNVGLPDRAEAVRLDDLTRSELFFAARKISDRW